MFSNIQQSVLKLCNQCYSIISQRTSCLTCYPQRGFSSLRQVKEFPISSFTSTNTNSNIIGGRWQTKSPSIVFSRAQHQQKCGGSQYLTGLGQSLRNMQKGSIIRSYSNAPPPKPASKRTESAGKSPITWKTVVLVVGVGGAVLLGMQQVRKEKELEREKNRNRKMGKAKLGGDWELTDHNGNRKSSVDFRGQWLLIYFGFTNCPDVCPEEIEKIITVINKLDKDKDIPTIQPIVISVDPDRDTPEALKEYLGEFSPRLLGFTGTREDVQKATRAYRVYFSAGPKDEDNDYIVDHSIISYLVNPHGEFVDYFGQNKTANEMYTAIRVHIYGYNKTEGRK